MSSRSFNRRAPRAPPPPPDALSVGGITLPCLQLKRTARFYAGVVGLPISGRSPRHVTLNADGVRVVLVDAGSTAGFSRGKSQTMFLELVVPDLESVRLRLAEDGARIYPVRRGSERRLLTTRDPEGNVLNMVLAGEGRSVS